MEAVTKTVGQAKRAVNAFGIGNFSVSGASGLYHRARPTYPAEAVTKLLSVLPNKSDCEIVEVGAGTGIFTQCLVSSPNLASKVARITAVEPSSGMREGFSKSPSLQTQEGQKPSIRVADGSFAEIPMSDASADIIVGAQCFHWAHPNYEESIKEFSRVLKPGGTLAFIWNLEDRKTAGWVGKIRDAYEAYEQGTPQYRLDWWRAVYETQTYKADFEPFERHDFRVIHPTTEQGVIDRVLSKSYITAQTAEEQAKIGENVVKILREGQDRKWIDEGQGIFEYPYETNLYLMRKKV